MNTIDKVPPAGLPTLMLWEVAAVEMFVAVRAESVGEANQASSHAILYDKSCPVPVTSTSPMPLPVPAAIVMPPPS
jgi:hypothetical protein